MGRIPVLVPVTWENGWPMMGVNGKAPVTLEIDGDYAGTFLAGDDDFSYSSNQLNLLWQWNHNPDNTAWSLTDRPGWLRLNNQTLATNLLNARNTLTQRTECPSCSSVIKLDASGMKSGDYAGLSAFQFKYGNIKADFYYSYDGNSWNKLGNTLSMAYDLKLFTGYRNGIYSYATKSTGGHADIDFFDYERTDWNTPSVIEPDANGWYFHSTFEGTTDDWTGRGAAEVSTSGRTAYAGSEALLVQGRTAAWNGATRSLNTRAFKPGSAYSFSANVMYLDGGASDTFFMKLQYRDGNGDTQYSTIAEGETIRGEWVQLRNTGYVISADASDMQLYIETADSTNNFYVDEAIGAVEGTEIQGVGDGRKLIRGDLNEDGRIDGVDLALIRRGLTAGFADSYAEIAADVNQDTQITVAEAVLIQNYLIGRIREFPVEAPEKSVG